jgi:adenosylhomocysteine nucleosidase
MADVLPRTLVVMALPAESAGRFERQGIPVLYTGVGKVNAAAALARRLAQYRCVDRALPLVVNFGTAGSRRHPAHTLVGCHRFIDRDMDVSALGFARGTTPFDPLPAVLEFAPRFSRLPAAVCGSGDSFAAEEMAVQFDVMDMEAYALAKVCHIEGADFACAKFVSDGADDASARDWQENVAGAADAFVALYRELVSCP